MTEHTTPLTGDVVYVVTDPGVPAYGRKGCSVHVQAILTQLARRARGTGHRVTLVATRLGGQAPPELADVETIELGRPTTSSPAEAEQALVALDERAAQIVAGLVAENTARGHRTLVYQRYGLWSAATLEVARTTGAATVLEVNAPLVEEQATHRVLVDEALATQMSARAVRAADLAYAVSTAVADWASDLAGVPVATIPNGVDVDRFTVAPGSTTDGTPAEPVVAFVGTFRPWHAPDLLIEAAARLTAEGTPVRLLLVGDGPMLDDTLAAAERAGVGVESTGAVDPARIPSLLARADVACAPYPAGQAYFSPLKVVEYLAAGLPTVSAAVADLSELLGADEAVLVTPGDVVALTDGLRALATDPALRARLGRAGREAAVARFGWSAVADTVLGRVRSGRPAPTPAGAA